MIDIGDRQRALDPSRHDRHAVVQVQGGQARVACATEHGCIIVSYRGADRLPAGLPTRFEIAIEADRALPAGACLALARRWPSDWGTPQWTHPDRLDFARVFASNSARLHCAPARRHAWHPFDHALVVELLDPLPAGETLGVRFGGTSADSPGFRVQTFAEEACPVSVRLLPAAGGEWVELARAAVRVVGAAAHRLVVTVPTRLQAGGELNAHVRLEDIWGNAASLESTATVALSKPGQEPVEVKLNATAWSRVQLRAPTSPGTIRVTARVPGRDDLVATSNPVQVVEGAPTELVVWGDLHAQSVIGCGVRSIGDYFGHARDFAATDFCSHQANCFLVSADEWAQTQDSTRAANDEGRFVTLLGVEWSGASRLGGDHNVYFPGDEAELRRCSHQFVDDKSDVDRDLVHVRDLYAHYAGSDTLLVVHVGGRTADLQFHEPMLDRLLEIHSTHATSEWFLFDALARGQRFGVTAGSDSVDGRPGASHPGRMGVRNVRGGLTAVIVPTLSRASLWQALKDRRCYATTGERIVLSLRAGAYRMGDEVHLPLGREHRLPPFQVTVEGTTGIEAIDFFRDDRLLRHVDYLDRLATPSRQVRVAWRGATAPGNWERARMSWDGALRVAGARIEAVAPWAFDTPDEGPTDVGDAHVAWRSVTAGDWDGVVLTLDRPDDAVLTFAAEPMTVQCALGPLGAQPWVYELQSPWRMLEVRRLPAGEPQWQVHQCFVDDAPQPGRHAYWVRVRQVDGSYAWSTPIFFDLTNP